MDSAGTGLPGEQIEQFWDRGYLVFDDVLTMKEVSELRALCESDNIRLTSRKRDLRRRPFTFSSSPQNTSCF